MFPVKSPLWHGDIFDIFVSLNWHLTNFLFFSATEPLIYRGSRQVTNIKQVISAYFLGFWQLKMSYLHYHNPAKKLGVLWLPPESVTTALPIIRKCCSQLPLSAVRLANSLQMSPLMADWGRKKHTQAIKSSRIWGHLPIRGGRCGTSWEHAGAAVHCSSLAYIQAAFHAPATSSHQVFGLAG